MLRTFRSCIHFLVLCGIIVGSIALPPTRLRAETNAPLDTPVTVVTNNKLEQWSIGAGLVYWSNDCSGEEFGTHADLKRKPVGGGTERDIQTIDDGTCRTFQNQLSTDKGLYFFNASANQIQKMPLAAPFAAQPVKNVENFQIPDDRAQPLIESNGYLYWGVFGAVYRTRTDGSSTIETVANASGTVSSVLVVGNLVYFVDNSRFTTNGGVKTISTNCATLPCSDTLGMIAPFAIGTEGHGLVYQPNAGGGSFSGYAVYWVQSATSSSKIRSCFINNFTPPCQDPVIQPLSAASIDETNRVSTFYETTISIGNPIFIPASAAKSTKDLYWTETGSGVSDVKRRATNASIPTTSADTIATGETNLDKRLFAADDFIYFARSYIGVYKLALNATAIVREFTADSMEVTQAIQNLANDAPLVARKPTYVRAYGKQIVGPNAPNVEARLVGLKNGSPLPGSPLQAINGLRSLVNGGTYDRARLNDGWLFQLPESWIANGQVTLRLEVDPRLVHNDPNRSDNAVSQNVSFQNQPPVCVWTVPVRTHTPKPSVNDPNFWSMVDQFTRRWPIPETWIFRDTEPVEELEFCSWHGIPYPCFGPYELEDGWGITNGIPDRDKVIVSLWTRAQLSFNPDACDDIGAPVHFMGLVHPDANNGGASGYASTVSDQSWVQLPDHLPNPMPVAWNSMREGSTMAQELAHNHGRKHVNCGNPDDIDNSYPYPPCQIANVGADSYYGFDIASRQPIRPDQASDFMSYGSRRWVSDYTWRALLGKFAASNVASASPLQSNATDSVFVSGLVDLENNRGEIVSLLILPTTSVPSATRQAAGVQAASLDHGGEPHAIYKLRLLDAANTILSEQTLTPLPMDDHSDDGASAIFSDLFDKPTGVVAKVQLLADNTVIDTIQPGTAQPIAAVTQPAAATIVENAMTIAWSASDADADDRLLFTLQYSHDNGAKWHTLVNNFPSTPEGQYTLTYNDLGSLQGSAANAALIRVLASDGFNTTIATSQPFTVKNRKPDVFIVNPLSAENYAAGDVVILRGGATDPEDGGLAGASLRWKIDGADVGNGAELAVAGLSTGNHTAELSATDGNSNSSTVSVVFSVSTLSLPLASSTPTLDGICNDAGYADATQIQLKPYGDGSQATARIVRGNDFLWACFTGMKKGATVPGAFAGLRIDVDGSGGNNAQPGDFGFFAGEDGSVSTTAGDGAGNFDAAGPGGLQAQVSSDSNTWNAELRIEKATLGGWDHLVRVNAGHYWADFQGDDYLWPYASLFNQPKSWAEAALGVQPTVTALDPFTATVGSAAFTLRIEGSGFVSGTVALWGNTPLVTTLVDSEQLTATVDAAQLSSAGIVKVGVRSPEPGNFASNKLDFKIEAQSPVISSLSPGTIVAESPTTTLTVNGSNFAGDSQVLWNGVPLVTTFVNSGQIKAQIDSALLEVGQTVGVAVRNQSPEERISDAKGFEVTAATEQSQRVYLPLVTR